MTAATRYPCAGYATTITNDLAVSWAPKRYQTDHSKRGVLFLRGAASGAVNPNAGILPQSPMTLLGRVATALEDLDLPMLSPQLGVSGSASADNWTNATALAGMTDAVTYLMGTLGAKTDKVLIVAHSMGAAQAMQYARANPSKVAAMVLLQPLSDVQDVVTNNRGGYASAINASYAGGYSDATYGATGNPAVFAAQLAGIPCQFWYSTDDSIVIPSTVTTVMGLIGASAALGGTGTGGHPGGLASFNTASMLTFLASYL